MKQNKNGISLQIANALITAGELALSTSDQ